MKSEKCQSCFFVPKIHALIHNPESEASRPFATYLARARGK